MDVITYAKRGLIATLEANLPAKLATLTPPTGIDYADPAPQFFDRALMSTDADVLGPIVAIDRTTSRPGAQYQTGEWLVTLRLDVYFPGPAGARSETLDAIHAFAAAIHDVVKDGDGRGQWMVGGDDYSRITVCRPVGLNVEPTVRAFGDGRTIAIPVARAFPEFTLQVWQD